MHKQKNQSIISKNSMNLASLSFLGVDMLNHISIVIKEISYLDKTDVNNSKSFSINPFNLNTKEVISSKTNNSNVITDELEKIMGNLI